MRQVKGFFLWTSLFFFLGAAPGWCKDSGKVEVSAKVCVAAISNRTGTSLFEVRLAARLAKDLQQDKVAAISMDSATTNDREIRPSVANGNEMKSQDCDYVLLTQVRDPKDNWGVPSSGGIHVGGRTPSTDASDPLGGQSGPVYRDDLEVHYALFRAGKFEADISAVTLERPSSAVADRLMPAMDRIANQVAHELKKKKK